MRNRTISKNYLCLVFLLAAVILAEAQSYCLSYAHGSRPDGKCVTFLRSNDAARTYLLLAIDPEWAASPEDKCKPDDTFSADHNPQLPHCLLSPADANAQATSMAKLQLARACVDATRLDSLVLRL